MLNFLLSSNMQPTLLSTD